MSEDEKVEYEICENAIEHVLNFANSQYSAQWTKIGNFQTSSSSVLTLVSVCGAFIIGNLNVPDNDFISNYAFYVSICITLISMVVTCFYIFKILRTKHYRGIKNPSGLRDQILNVYSNFRTKYPLEYSKPYLTNWLIDMINVEMKKTDELLKKNRESYGNALVSSFFALASGMVSMLLANSNIFSNNDIVFVILEEISLLIIPAFIITFIILKIVNEKKLRRRKNGERK